MKKEHQNYPKQKLTKCFIQLTQPKIIENVILENEKIEKLTNKKKIQHIFPKLNLRNNHWKQFCFFDKNNIKIAYFFYFFHNFFFMMKNNFHIDNQFIIDQ